MGVYLGSLDRSVSQELLNLGQMHSGPHHVRGARVAQPMKRHGPRDPGLLEIAPEQVRNPVGSVVERLRLGTIQG